MAGPVRLGAWLGLMLAIGLPGAPGKGKLGAGCPLPKPALTWRRMPSFSLAPGP